MDIGAILTHGKFAGDEDGVIEKAKAAGRYKQIKISKSHGTLFLIPNVHCKCCKPIELSITPQIWFTYFVAIFPFFPSIINIQGIPLGVLK